MMKTLALFNVGEAQNFSHKDPLLDFMSKL